MSYFDLFLTLNLYVPLDFGAILLLANPLKIFSFVSFNICKFSSVSSILSTSQASKELKPILDILKHIVSTSSIIKIIRKATDLFMIAFVAEYNADVNARTILNTNEVKLTDVVEIDPTSIEEATDVAFSVYPNPATDYAMISSNATIKEIAIINTVGQTVATFTANAENVQINTQDLVKGVYMVSITTTEGSAVKKLTVVK